jgi:hypothetical protein
VDIVALTGGIDRGRHGNAPGRETAAVDCGIGSEARRDRSDMSSGPASPAFPKPGAPGAGSTMSNGTGLGQRAIEEKSQQAPDGSQASNTDVWS